MTSTPNDFLSAARIAVQDDRLVAAVTQATHAAATKREAAMFAHGREHGEALREQAAVVRRHALSHLPELLEQAEAQMRANGIQVLWASDGTEVCDHVLAIARQHGVKRIAKSKSMVSEEVALNHALEAAGYEVIETDLGEFIVQLAGETPSHIVTPVIHKSKEAIRDLFIERLGMTPTDDAQAMTRFAREHLRQAFLKAEMGITGGNFIIAETGTLCLVTNEGNGRMVTSLPPVHVAIVGIEKVVETLEDYALLTQVLPRSATGQAMTVYTHMINGPRREGESSGPEHMVVILVDNGRTDIYASSYVEALACIRCGACMNACPVYKVVGGHTYGWVYPGPIGAVVTPLLTGFENAKLLPYASSLCGVCKEVCPVDIDLPRLLLDLRHDLVEQKQQPWPWRVGLRVWAVVTRSPWRFVWASRLVRWGGALLPRNRHVPLGPLGGWSRSRNIPPLPSETFRRWWQRHQEEGQR